MFFDISRIMNVSRKVSHVNDIFNVCIGIVIFQSAIAFLRVQQGQRLGPVHFLFSLPVSELNVNFGPVM